MVRFTAYAGLRAGAVAAVPVGRVQVAPAGVEGAHWTGRSAESVSEGEDCFLIYGPVPNIWPCTERLDDGYQGGTGTRYRFHGARIWAEDRRTKN